LDRRADDVSVVIPNFNGAGLLGETLGALAAQTVSGFRVLVVDNASSDDSLAVLARHPHVDVLRLPRNRGFAGGANAGLAAAVTPLVAVLNSDARPAPSWLAELLTVVGESPDDVWGWGSVLLHKDGTIESAGDAWRGTSAYKLLREQPVGALPHQPYEVFAPPGAAPLFRTDVVRQLGGYDETFFLYYEDIDLAWRARLLGHRAVLVPAARVTHLGGASSTGRQQAARAWFHIARNSLWCAVRCPPEVHPRALLRATRRELSTARERGVAGAYLRGRAAGVVGLPRQLRRRRALQAGRLVDTRALATFLATQEEHLGS
jgi:GT2 family glycosyltransferase